MIEVFFDDLKVTHSKSPIIESTDYYPFGLTFNSYSRENSTPNQYKFNGKEEQDELSLGWYDYQARYYDPSIARWMVVDPMADLSSRWSPYTYCYNNPLIFIDPDGMIVEFAKNTSDEDKKKFLDRQKELNSESRRARRQWNKLEKSKNVHTVHLNENDENGNRRNSQTIQKGPTDNKKGNGTDIYMDLDEKSPGGDELDTQGHEQAHALDLDKGKLKDIKPESDTKEDIEKAHNQMLIVGETRASKVENKIRKQRGTELRETYFIPLGFEYDPESGFNKMNYHVIQLVKKKKKKNE